MKNMFNLPKDTTINACLDFGNDSANLSATSPDITGWPVYQFESDCQQIGLAYSDKKLTLAGAVGSCYIIDRTWYFGSWCQPEISSSNWYQNPGLVSDTYLQRIEIIDSIPPICAISLFKAAQSGGESSVCTSDVDATVIFSDNCGLSRYDYILENLNIENSQIVDQGGAELAGEVYDSLKITWPNMQSGTYKFKIRTIDHCGNESYCSDTFNIDSLTDCMNAASGITRNSEFDVDQEIKTAKRNGFALEQNIPNPFLKSTKIKFSLFESGLVRFMLRTHNGEIIRVEENFYQEGNHEIILDGADFQSSGIIYYQLTTKNMTQTKMMLLIK